MIKFEDNVLKVIKKIEAAGHIAYAAGPCIRKAYAGEKTPYWDIITDASADELKSMFPEGETIGKDFEICADYKDEDGTEYEDGMVIDVSVIEKSIEKDLAKYIFTVDALADNPQRKFVDPYGGIDDYKDGMINVIGNAQELFIKSPEMMLNAIYLVGETGGKLSKEMYYALKENGQLVKKLDKSIIRDYLDNIMASANTGEALSLIQRVDMMFILYGEEVAAGLNRSELKDFKMLCENIDKTLRISSRRTGALYGFLPKNKIHKAISDMEFEEPLLTNLTDVANDFIKMQFLNNPMQFKKFLFEHGQERYDYMHNLSKAMKIIFEHSNNRIESRNWNMQNIKTNHEPVFLEDLKIDANDLMEAGIAADAEQAMEILSNVVAIVHKNPVNNQRDVLLKAAEKMAKSSFAVKTRYITWLR